MKAYKVSRIYLSIFILFLSYNTYSQDKTFGLEFGYEYSSFPGGIVSFGIVNSKSNTSYGMKVMYWNLFLGKEEFQPQGYLINAAGFKFFIRSKKPEAQEAFLKKVYWEYSISMLSKSNIEQYLKENYNNIWIQYEGEPDLYLIENGTINLPMKSSLVLIPNFQIKPSYPIFLRRNKRLDIGLFMGLNLIFERIEFDLKNSIYSEYNSFTHSDWYTIGQIGISLNYRL